MRDYVHNFFASVERAGFISFALDLPFVMSAIKSGELDLEAAHRVATILSDEIEMFGGNMAEGITLYKDRLSLPRTPFNVDLGTGRISARRFRSFEATMKDAFASMAASFPESASAYSDLITEVVSELGSASESGEVSVQRGAVAHARLVFDVLGAERMWQQNFVQHATNGLSLAALKRLSPPPEGILELERAHELFANAGAGKLVDLGQTGFERESLSIQLPILSARLMALSGEAGIETSIRRIGRVMMASAKELGDIEIELSNYARLDRAMLIGGQVLGKRLVSLPVTREMVGDEAWLRLARSIFFMQHPGRLLPSNAFWNIRSCPMDEDKIAAMVLYNLPEGSKLIEGGYMDPIACKNLRPGLCFASPGAAGSKPSAVYHVLADQEQNQYSRISIVEHMPVGERFEPVAGLVLKMAGSDIEEAEYRVFTPDELSIEVTPDRIDELEARASAGFVPLVLPLALGR